MSYVWVIEIKDGDKWEPLPNVCKLTRKTGYDGKEWLEKHNITDKFRVKKYVRSEK